MSRRPALIPFLFVAALGLSACTTPAGQIDEAGAATMPPSSSPTASAPVSPDVAPSSSTEPSAIPASFASCDETVTSEFRAELADLGWVGWNMVGQEIGHSPFDAFPGGAPVGQLSCRFGAGPDVATDNVLDLAWAPIDGSAATSAQEYLADAGFERLDVPEGVQWALRGESGGWADAEGWGQTYLFTGTDVRWAQVRDDLGHLQPAA
ncbi:hypothetical protein NS206_02015 [Microbacterium testaceum]|uniref:hypothetical protein n=1 Tax=Microbacterium testaceum TaxID=2033 RepID=UPI000734A19D|nr:hypothetical protein [Microbacterium testaceum]KTS70084.1 hypothetical protein NS206_02015 [Microbacterium testaceum]